MTVASKQVVSYRIQAQRKGNHSELPGSSHAPDLTVQ